MSSLHESNGHNPAKAGQRHWTHSWTTWSLVMSAGAVLGMAMRVITLMYTGIFETWVVIAGVQAALTWSYTKKLLEARRTSDQGERLSGDVWVAPFVILAPLITDSISWVVYLLFIYDW